MPYDEIKREMTLQEEIQNLDVPPHVKERLLQKLKEQDYRMEKAVEERETRTADVYEKLDRMREQNISLKSACFALAAALKQEYEL